MQFFLQAIGIGFLLSVMVGPVFFVLLETSITKGIRAALALDIGVFISDVLYIMFALSFVDQITSINSGENKLIFGFIGGSIFIIYGTFYFFKKSKMVDLTLEAENTSKEVAAAPKDYLLLGLKLENNPLRFSEAFNFGPESEDTFSVAEMVELAIKQWGGGDFKIEMNDNQPHEAGVLKLDINKAKSELDWKPLMNAENAIKSTIMWYNKFKSDINKIDSFTTQFIKTSFNYEN